MSRIPLGYDHLELLVIVVVVGGMVRGVCGIVDGLRRVCVIHTKNMIVQMRELGEFVVEE